MENLSTYETRLLSARTGTVGTHGDGRHARGRSARTGTVGTHGDGRHARAVQLISRILVLTLMFWGVKIFGQCNGTCTYASCDFVGNGGFEVNSGSCGYITEAPVATQCWCASNITPDLFIRNCPANVVPAGVTSSCVNSLGSPACTTATAAIVPISDSHNGVAANNNAYAGLWGAAVPNPAAPGTMTFVHEILQTDLSAPLVNGVSYTLSFWVRVDRNGAQLPNTYVTDIPANVSFHWESGATPITAGTGVTNPSPLLDNSASFVVGNLPSGNPNLTPLQSGDNNYSDWQFFSTTFAFIGNPVGGNMRVGIVITPTIPNFGPSYASYVLIDDVSLQATNSALQPLTISKRIIEAPNEQYVYYPGDYVTYAITVTNNSPCTLNNLQIQDVLSSEFDLSGLIPNNSCGSLGFAMNGNTLTSNLFSIPVNSSVTLCFSVPIDPYTDVCNIENCASVTHLGSNQTINSNCVTIYIVPPNTDVLILGDTYSSVVFGTGSYFVNQNVFLAGHFIIDYGSATFKDCDITTIPGAKITTYARLTFDNSHLHASCDKMWHGIDVRDDDFLGTPALHILNSTVEDAYIAVDKHISKPQLASSNIKVRIRNSFFNKNYISLNIMDVEYNYTSRVVFEDNCQFRCDGLLLPNYSPSLPVCGKTSFAAINVENYPFDLKTTNGGIISFDNHAYGIRAFYSPLRIRDCKFTNIKPVPLYEQPGGPTLSGCAVFGSGYAQDWTVPNGTASLDLNGTLPGGQTAFDNCRIGVHAIHNRKLYVNQCKMTNMRTGVGLWFMNNATSANVDNNEIEATLNGVHTYLCTGANSIGILNNKINITNTPSGYLPIGILNNELFNSPLSAAVQGNEVDMDAAGVGVLTQGASKSLFIDNSVRLLSAQSQPGGIDGFRLNSGLSHSLRCNSVLGLGAAGKQYASAPLAGTEQTAYRFNASPFNRTECNFSHRTRTGFHFSGYSAYDYGFKGNEMKDHYVGLFLPINGIMGIQKVDVNNPQFNGNRWTGVATWYQAVNQNLPLNLALSRFDVEWGVPITNPTTNVGLWFYQIVNTNNQIPTYACTNPCMTPCPNCSVIVGDITETERSVAAGDSLTGSFVEENLWAAQRVLYARLDSMYGLGGDSLLAAFHQQAQGGSIGSFALTDEELQTMLADWDAQNKAARDALESGMDAVEAAFNLTDGLLAAGGIDSSTWILQTDSLRTLHNQQRSALAYLYRTERQLDSLQSVGINADNQQVPTNRLFEANEREVKDIYTRTLGIWQGFTSADLGILETIASQCPLEGGAAVYWARTMLYFVNDSLVFDDKSACEIAGLQYRHSGNILGTSAQEVKIYPNPANDKLHISVPSGISVVRIELYDALSRCVLKKEVSPNPGLDISSLPNGIYQVKLWENETLLLSSKLIITL